MIPVLGLRFLVEATRRNVDGETPICSLKKREKFPGEEKPNSHATEVNGSSRHIRRRTTSSTRTALQKTCGVVFNWSRNIAKKWARDKPTRPAISSTEIGPAAWARIWAMAARKRWSISGTCDKGRKFLVNVSPYPIANSIKDST